MQREVRLLTTTGQGFYEEIIWNKPEVKDDEIEVKAIMTGVCRSDIDMMLGQFNLPLWMHGHEGLGIVTQIGTSISDVVVGDFVATRGEPAYADFYNAKRQTYVKVPQLNPKYIVEPIACGINIFRKVWRAAIGMDNPKIVIIGSGFLSSIVYKNFVLRHITNIDVIGKHNLDFWKTEHNVELIDYPQQKYDIVIDLSNNDITLTKDIFNSNALLILASSKHPQIASTFDYWLWNAITIMCPSPRDLDFHACMLEAVSQIETGKLNVDSFWTRGYNRNTEEWRLAFIDSLDRTPNFNRAFIYW
jgi:D-arabinose 1-dehydrogenase-like Zn-dependent alcohol dehydrogenase